jgi:hypothetical protein
VHWHSDSAGALVLLSMCVVLHLPSYCSLTPLPEHLDWFALGKLINPCEEIIF